MIVIEQQLLSALRETPFETDCSVSIDVLRSLGHLTAEAQRCWLVTHRPPANGKLWHQSGDRWEYCSGIVEPMEILSAPLPMRAVTAPPIGMKSIVVKPLGPLKKMVR